MLESDSSAVMATLATPIRTKAKLDDPACVKVVFNQQGQALYFSRSWIPFARDWDSALLQHDPPSFYQHIGLYAYRRDFLQQFCQLPASRLEELEKLEQLRVLDAGHKIVIDVVSEPAAGIDTQEDYDHFVTKFRSQSKAA
jgi:3-deoxy-manno-octulosonate cytidylyltransferase (CMP-KDO synthetase)